MKHKFHSCNDPDCMPCIGGLQLCDVCRQAEGDLEEECPGPHPATQLPKVALCASCLRPAVRGGVQKIEANIVLPTGPTVNISIQVKVTDPEGGIVCEQCNTNLLLGVVMLEDERVNPIRGIPDAVKRGMN